MLFSVSRMLIRHINNVLIRTSVKCKNTERQRNVKHSWIKKFLSQQKQTILLSSFLQQSCKAWLHCRKNNTNINIRKYILNYNHSTVKFSSWNVLLNFSAFAHRIKHTVWKIYRWYWLYFLCKLRKILT